MAIYNIILSLFSASFAHLLLFPGVLKMMENTWHKKNYKNVYIAFPSGIYFSVSILLIAAAIFCVNRYFSVGNITDINVLLVFITILSASFSGYIDDMGLDAEKGIMSRISLIVKGRISTGVLKVIFAILTDIVVCTVCGFIGWNFIINLILLLLIQNFFNLLDLRPARAIKTYFIFSIVLLPFLFNSEFYLYLNSGFLLSLVLYLPYEISENCMAGDTGANVLGVMIGLIAISIENIMPRLILFLFLIMVHLYAEKYSISLLIKKNKVLQFIDIAGTNNVYKDKKRYCKRNNKKL